MGGVLSTEETRAVVMAVAHGEASWSALTRLGLEVGHDERGCLVLREPANLPYVPVTARDLARGFVAHQDSVEELRVWAFVVETSDCFEIGDVEDQPGGGAVRDALWQAAFGEPIGEDLLATVRAVAADREHGPLGCAEVEIG